MNVTAEHAGGAVVLELDEGCRSVAALRRIISAALPDVREDGFDVTVQGRAVEDVDVCGLEEGATIQVVESRRVVALAALRAAGRDVSEGGLKDGLRDAVAEGDAVLCEHYLDAGVSAALLSEPRRNRSLSLLQHALSGYVHPSFALCELLLSRGCDVNNHDSFASPALHTAAAEGLPDLCSLFLQHGADVHSRASTSATPLHSCSHDYQEAARDHSVREVLLRHGADMRAEDHRGRSPLDQARETRQQCVKPGWKPPPFNALDQFIKYGAAEASETSIEPPRRGEGIAVRL